jgi:hypothetical protein
MIQVVVSTFTAIAMPFCVNVRVPVLVLPDKIMVSETMAINRFAAVLFTNIICVPIG